MKYPKRRQYKYTKKAYRVRNWRAYEEGLRWRGDLTIWLSEEALRAWRAPASGKPGGQRIYANIAIETVLTVRLVYHLALRQTEGFLRSLASQLELDLPIPDHTTLSRRARKLGKIRFAPGASSRPIHILIDSTGLKIHVGNLREPPKHRECAQAACRGQPQVRPRRGVGADQQGGSGLRPRPCVAQADRESIGIGLSRRRVRHRERLPGNLRA